jgi:hypothetical protein
MTRSNALTFASLLALITVCGYVFIYNAFQHGDTTDPVARRVAVLHKNVVPLAAARIAPVSKPAAPVSTEIVDDSDAAEGGRRFVYTGTWEHVHGLYDGRSYGTSTRTFHVGAKAFFAFSGARLRLFGIKGPSGGYADVSIDGQPYATISFYSPHKESGVLVYSSSALSHGTHSAEISVVQAPDRSERNGYVNLDGAAVSSS